MRWTSLEEWRRRFAVSHHLQLPALLVMRRTPEESVGSVLQYNEGEQNEPDVANHRLIHSALTRLQSRILLGVAKERLYLPATHLALHHARKVGSGVVGDDVLCATRRPCASWQTSRSTPPRRASWQTPFR